MNDANVKKMREQLYTDVWAEPMTAVAKKYNLSDNGIRKRCKSLNIPVPPFGYWPKKKAGKVVSERLPLPPYNEIVLDVGIKEAMKEASADHSIKKTNSLELRDLDDMPIEQLSTLHGLDLIELGSREYFDDWLDAILVPGRVNDYDNLISRHKSEIEYREARDKAYPFRKDHIKLWTVSNKVNERDNISVLPIEVSSSQLGRAYRIVDTIIKAFQKLKANISVENNGKDNLNISLLSSTASFEVSESKTKRRHLISSSDMHDDFRPLYEEIYDGTLQMAWKITGYEQYSYRPNLNKKPAFQLTYCDSKDLLLETQVSRMILEVYKQCCENQLKHALEKKKWEQKYELEEKERREKEEDQNRLKLEEKRQARLNSLFNEILEQSDNWFKHEQLIRYADELEKYLAACLDTETVCLLEKYIRLVRENANKFNPLNDILDKMRNIESE